MKRRHFLETLLAVPVALAAAPCLPVAVTPAPLVFNPEAFAWVMREMPVRMDVLYGVATLCP